MDGQAVFAAAAAGVLGAIWYQSSRSDPMGASMQDQTTTMDVFKEADQKIWPWMYAREIGAAREGHPTDLFQRDQELNTRVGSDNGATLDGLRSLVATKAKARQAAHIGAFRDRAVTKVPDSNFPAKHLPGALSDFTQDPVLYKPWSRYHGEVHVPGPYNPPQ